MPVHFDKEKQRWRFKFSRVIAGRSYRASRLLPKGWSKAQAYDYDRRETARLYDLSTGKAPDKPLIADAVKLYVEDWCPQLKTGKNIIGVLAYIYWAYKDKAIDDLPEVAKTLSSYEVGKVKPATIRNRIAYVRAACNHYLKATGAKERAAPLILPEVNNERHLYLSREQMLTLAKACEKRDTRKVIRIAFYSGMRLSEILSQGPSEEVFKLYNTKNDDPRYVPIHPKIASLARTLPLKSKKSTIQKWFRIARAKVGMEHVHLHDERHSAASAMVNKGVDLYTIAGVLGQRDVRSTKRYSHLKVDTLTAAVRKIG